MVLPQDHGDSEVDAQRRIAVLASRVADIERDAAHASIMIAVLVRLVVDQGILDRDLVAEAIDRAALRLEAARSVADDHRRQAIDDARIALSALIASLRRPAG